MTPTTILVVEDEPVIAYDLRQTLGELGYTVPTTVATGEQAIETAGRLRPHLVLMDIKLKGEMDGVAAAKVIRDRFAIPVLYLTSHSSDATLTRAAETRPHGFVVKPFCDRDLSVAIEVALKRHAVESRCEGVAGLDLPPESDDPVLCRSILSTRPPKPDGDGNALRSTPLPRRASSVRAQRRRRDRGLVEGAAMTSQCILVVEDEPLIAADIQDVLEGFGYAVPPSASTMAAALRSVAQFRPDLVLMDVRLKGGDDGVATAAAIRERWSVPVVFLTSHADEATLSRAQVVEPFGYLLKPFNDFELRATVQMVLQRSRREETILRESKILTVAVNGAPEAVVAVDGDGKVLFRNEAARRSEAEADGSYVSSWTTGSSALRLADRETPFPSEDLPLARALRGETVSDVEIFIQPRAGGLLGSLYSMNAAPLRDRDGQVVGAVAIARDVMAARLILSDLHQRAETDDMTGTYNRRGFMEAAGASLQLAAHTGQTPALFFIDLNGLKQINDVLGHAEGDRAIVDAAAVLRSAFRTSDIVARLGGDEFVVLATDASDHSKLLRERLDQSVVQFNQDAGRQYRLSMSVGVAECDPASGATLASLLGQADQRMYEAKALRAKAVTEPVTSRRSGTPDRGSTA